MRYRYKSFWEKHTPGAHPRGIGTPLARAYAYACTNVLCGVVVGTGIDTGRAWAAGEDAGGRLARSDEYEAGHTTIFYN